MSAPVAFHPTRWRAWPLLGILIGALLLRGLFLGSLPPALFRDEAEKLYTAWCLATTGHDAEGRLLPLFIRVFGVTTSAVYQYAAIPFVWLLGPNEWSARLPAAVVGTLTVLFLWLWARRVYGELVANWAALLLALSPWHVVFSRWAQQGIFLPLWLAVGMWAWSNFLRGKRWGAILAGACLGLAIYTYDVARLFVPLFTLGFACFHSKEIRQRWRDTLLALLAFGLCAFPTFVLLVTATEQAQARFQRISIFQPDASLVSIVRVFLGNYFAHYSPGFLLWRGDAELRHGAGVGVLNWVEAVTLVVGLGVAVRRRSPWDRTLLWWFLVFPVAASLTREGIPHALRSIVAQPAVAMLSGIGAAQLILAVRETWRKHIAQLIFLGALVGFLPFAARYFGPYRHESAANWQYGVKQSLELLAPHLDLVDSVVFYNIFGAEYLVGVYAKIPPRAFQLNSPRMGKFEFPPFHAPLRELYRARVGPTAYVTLPLYPPPPEGHVVAISAKENASPVAVVYLNRPLWERLRERGDGASNKP